MGTFSGNGTYITLTSPDRKQLTLIISMLVSMLIYILKLLYTVFIISEPLFIIAIKAKPIHRCF